MDAKTIKPIIASLMMLATLSMVTARGVRAGCPDTQPDVAVTGIDIRPLSDNAQAEVTMTVRNIGAAQLAGAMQQLDLYQGNRRLGGHAVPRLAAGVTHSTALTVLIGNRSFTAIYVPEPDGASRMDCNPGNNRMTRALPLVRSSARTGPIVPHVR